MLMKKLKFLLEYALARLLAFLFSLLPWRALPAIAKFSSFFLPYVLPTRRAIVTRNLAQAFPEKSVGERQAIAHEFWRRIILTGLEFLKSTGGVTDWLKENVFLENVKALDDALAQGKGVLIHTGHFGNWELAGLAIPQAGYALCGVGRRQRNPYFDSWLNSLRSRFGMKVFNHHQAARETLSSLRANSCLAILIDHNLYQGGIFVDFFGRPASTTTLTALLHLKLGSPIIGFYPYRKNGKHYMRFEAIPTSAGQASDRDEAARQITRQLTAKMEDWIREDPANWLWGHDRWKRKPE